MNNSNLFKTLNETSKTNLLAGMRKATESYPKSRISPEMRVAFMSLSKDDQADLFAAALGGSFYGATLLELIKAGRLNGHQIEGLKAGTMAVRVIDFHAPEQSEEVNEHIDLLARLALIRADTLAWHVSHRDFLMKHFPDELDERDRAERKIAAAAESLDIMLVDLRRRSVPLA